MAGSNSQAIADVLPATKTEKNTDKQNNQNNNNEKKNLDELNDKEQKSLDEIVSRIFAKM